MPAEPPPPTPDADPVPPGPALRERKRRDSRAATVEAAFDLFDERGYDQVTVADICAAAGIGRRTFFRYFGTRDDVLSEPAREMSERVAAAIVAAPTAMPDGLVLRQALAASADYALDHRPYLRQIARIMRNAAAAGRSPFLRLADQEERMAHLLMQRRDPDQPPDWQTRLLVAHAVAAYRVWIDDLAADRPIDFRRHFDAIFDYDSMFALRTDSDRA